MSLSRMMILPETVDTSLLKFQVRDKESFPYAREIAKPFGALDPVIRWCKEELQADWRWQMVEMSNDQRPGRYIFYFDSERDCCAFVLKWC
jgi:hypothetical protein